MKNLFVILVILMVFRPAFPFIEYWANYDYIVNELCENKDKPMMHCEGKCHLNSELSKSNNSSDAPELIFQNIMGTPAVLPNNFSLPTFELELPFTVENKFFHYHESIDQYSGSIDIPPCILG